jgi:hypothetical protein
MGVMAATAGAGGTMSGLATSASAGECSNWQTVHASLVESVCPWTGAATDRQSSRIADTHAILTRQT